MKLREDISSLTKFLEDELRVGGSAVKRRMAEAGKHARDEWLARLAAELVACVNRPVHCRTTLPEHDKRHPDMRDLARIIAMLIDVPQAARAGARADARARARAGGCALDRSGERC